MFEIVARFVSQPWIGTVLALLGLLAAYYFYRKSQRQPRISHQRSEVAIVGGGTTDFPSDLQIRFGDKVVPRVTSTRIILWNSGNETFSRNQLLDDDPLRVEISEGETILQASVLRRTRGVNNLVLAMNEESPRSANIAFEYLDPEDGATLEVLHTDSRTNLGIKGTIKGLPHGLSDWGLIELQKAAVVSRRVTPRVLRLVILVIAGFTFIGFAVFRSRFFWWRSDIPIAPVLSGADWLFIGMGLIYVVGAFAEFWASRKRYPVQLALSAASDDLGATRTQIKT